MTKLVSIRGGGEVPPPPVCVICGVPAPHVCGVLRRHLAWRRLRGDTPATVYSTEKGILLLGRWLQSSGRTPGPVPVLDATPAHLAAWQASLDMSASSIASYTSRARAFYRWAVEDGLIQADPSARLPVPRTGRRLPRPIDAEELFWAIRNSPPRIRPWLILAAFCGLRAKEVAYLRREAIMETAPQPVLLVTKEAAKGGIHERVIPLSTYVLGELRTWNLPATGYCFRRLDGHAGPNPPWRVSQLSNEFLHNSGITATFHQLRHFFGSSAYAAERDLRVTQELLGHSSPVTTAGYAAFSNASAISAVEGIPNPGRLQVVRDGQSSRSRRPSSRR